MVLNTSFLASFVIGLEYLRIALSTTFPSLSRIQIAPTLFLQTGPSLISLTTKYIKLILLTLAFSSPYLH